MMSESKFVEFFVESLQEKSPPGMKKKFTHNPKVTRAFNKEYGEEEGKKIKYATAWKRANESVFGEAKKDKEELPTDDAVPPMDDSDAFAASLDKDTPADLFDTEPMGDPSADYIQTAKHWVHKLDQFARELNDLDSDSLNNFLNQVDFEGSVLRGIAKSQSNNVTSIAGNLRDLAEELKGNLISGPKKQRELQQQQATATAPAPVAPAPPINIPQL